MFGSIEPATSHPILIHSGQSCRYYEAQNPTFLFSAFSLSPFFSSMLFPFRSNRSSFFSLSLTFFFSRSTFEWDRRKRAKTKKSLFEKEIWPTDWHKDGQTDRPPNLKRLQQPRQQLEALSGRWCVFKQQQQQRSMLKPVIAFHGFVSTNGDGKILHGRKKTVLAFRPKYFSARI